MRARAARLVALKSTETLDPTSSSELVLMDEPSQQRAL
jgi:hypothetical protein